MSKELEFKVLPRVGDHIPAVGEIDRNEIVMVENTQQGKLTRVLYCRTAQGTVEPLNALPDLSNVDPVAARNALQITDAAFRAVAPPIDPLPGTMWLEINAAGVPLELWYWSGQAWIAQRTDSFATSTYGTFNGNVTAMAFSGTINLDANIMLTRLQIDARLQSAIAPNGAGGATNSTQNYYDFQLKRLNASNVAATIAQGVTLKDKTYLANSDVILNSPLPNLVQQMTFDGNTNPLYTRGFELLATKTNSFSLNYVKATLFYKLVRK